jgi:hypothetical protein
LQAALEMNTFPILVLEDDVGVQGFPDSPIECPDDADAIYLGTSHGSPDYRATPVSDLLFRIERVYAAHAVVHLTPDYAEAVIADGRRSIYERNEPFCTITSPRRGPARTPRSTSANAPRKDMNRFS